MASREFHNPSHNRARQDATGAKERVDPVPSEVRKDAVEIRRRRHSEHDERDADRLGRLFGLGNRSFMTGFRGRRTQNGYTGDRGPVITSWDSARGLKAKYPMCGTARLPIRCPTDRRGRWTRAHTITAATRLVHEFMAILRRLLGATLRRSCFDELPLNRDGIPLRSTNRIQARSLTRGRPPSGRDGGSGRSGSISSHHPLGNSAAALSRRYGVHVQRGFPRRCFSL